MSEVIRDKKAAREAEERRKREQANLTERLRRLLGNADFRELIVRWLNMGQVYATQFFDDGHDAYFAGRRSLAVDMLRDLELVGDDELLLQLLRRWHGSARDQVKAGDTAP